MHRITFAAPPAADQRKAHPECASAGSWRLHLQDEHGYRHMWLLGRAGRCGTHSHMILAMGRRDGATLYLAEAHSVCGSRKLLGHDSVQGTNWQDATCTTCRALMGRISTAYHEGNDTHLQCATAGEDFAGFRRADLLLLAEQNAADVEPAHALVAATETVRMYLRREIELPT